MPGQPVRYCLRHQLVHWLGYLLPIGVQARPAEVGRALVRKSAQAIILPADAQQLKSVLEKLLADGVIAKTAEGLQFTGKKPASRGP